MSARRTSLVLGQNRDDVRQHNLSIVLTMLHLSGQVSRSLLTSATGLNRSTISDLVSELQELGLAEESEAAAPSGVGRPSLMVAPSESVVAFTVHPEIDATTVGLVTLGGKVLRRERILNGGAPTPKQSAEIAAKAIEQIRAELPAQTKIAGVGVAVPGQVRVSDGVIRLAPHLGWVEAPFGPALSQLTGLPVYLDNDASLGCKAERDFGAARGLSDVIYLYAGSGGVGGGVIADGNKLLGSSGYAGELGHVRISSSTKKDYSGLEGTLEALVSRDEVLDALKLFGADDEEIDREINGQLSTKVKRVLDAQIEYLAQGLATYVNIFNPQAIVLAGFLTSLFSYAPDRVIEIMRSNTLAASHEKVIIKNGELGSNLMMIGSADLAFYALLSRPSEAQLVFAKPKKTK
ncbi:MAG: hypothetical protein RL174_755 [Actinomycetota bacterium]